MDSIGFSFCFFLFLLFCFDLACVSRPPADSELLIPKPTVEENSKLQNFAALQEIADQITLCCLFVCEFYCFRKNGRNIELHICTISTNMCFVEQFFFSVLRKYAIVQKRMADGMPHWIVRVFIWSHMRSSLNDISVLSYIWCTRSSFTFRFFTFFHFCLLKYSQRRNEPQRERKNIYATTAYWTGSRVY